MIASSAKKVVCSKSESHCPIFNSIYYRYDAGLEKSFATGGLDPLLRIANEPRLTLLEKNRYDFFQILEIAVAAAVCRLQHRLPALRRRRDGHPAVQDTVESTGREDRPPAVPEASPGPGGPDTD